MYVFIRFSSILFFVAILFFMFKEKTFASCSTSYGLSFTTVGQISTLNGGYTANACSYHIDQVEISFKTDMTGTYNLEYSLNGGNTWNSQYFGATNSAQINISDTTSFHTLTSVIDPSFLIANSGGIYHIDNTKFSLRFNSPDTTGYTISSSTVTFEQILDDSAVPISGSTLASINPIKVCDPLDIPCNLVNGITNLLTFLFRPPNNFATNTYTLVKGDFDTKIPFAYIDTALGTDFSNTATSTAIPDFIMPFPTGVVLGQTIAIPQQTIHFPDNVHTAMGTIRSMLNYGPYAGLILYFITLAQRVI